MNLINYTPNLRNSELKTLLIFTVIIWLFSIVTRYILFEGWDGIGILLSGIVATALLWAIANSLKSLSLLIVLPLSPFIALMIEIFHWELVSLSFNREFSWQLDYFDLRRYAIGLYMWSLFYLTLFLGYFAIFNYFRFMRVSHANNEARLSAHKAQLKMLRYQINPHFLFNALNSVSALILENKNDRAEHMIENLSKFLRYSLDKAPSIKISLREEIDIIKEYLKIEEIRFSDKMKTIFDIKPETLDCLVPSLILQPAIENSMKHAITKMKENGVITITSLIVEGQLKVCICDNGPGLENSSEVHGIGLQNMRERLAVNYTPPAKLTVNGADGGGVEVCIIVPVERE